eukprot:UN09562
MGYTIRAVVFHSIILAKIAADDIFAYHDTLKTVQNVVQTNLSTPKELKNDPQRPMRFVDVLTDSVSSSSPNKHQDLLHVVEDFNNFTEFTKYPYNALYERYLTQDVMNNNDNNQDQQQQQDKEQKEQQ